MLRAVDYSVLDTLIGGDSAMDDPAGDVDVAWYDRVLQGYWNYPFCNSFGIRRPLAVSLEDIDLVNQGQFGGPF